MAEPEAARGPAGPAPKSPATRPPPSEEEINSPEFRTLALLFVIFAVTAGSWGAARFACNMHPPESRSAPKLATERLIGTAKDGAIEFVQRYRSSDFDGALEIATGDLVQQVRREKGECDAKANECARKREASAGRLTTAIVLTQEGYRADVRVTTELKGQKETLRVAMGRKEATWVATGMTIEGR